jgi:hypothetical protein
MTEWISVRDKKPKTDQTVLCLLADGCHQILSYDEYGYFKAVIPYDPSWMNYHELMPVTHWMPLPLPPLEKRF